MTYQANNIVSHSKRAVASATCIIGGGIGGIIAGVAFKSSESPKYTVSRVQICQNIADVTDWCIRHFGIQYSQHLLYWNHGFSFLETKQKSSSW